jgi:branched-chain amino acid transport system permease protein
MSWNEVGLYLVQGLTSGSAYALVAVAISGIYGATRVVNFPLGDIAIVASLLGGASLAIGAGMPVILAIPIVMVVSGALSMVVSFTLLPPFRGPRAEHDHGWLIAAVAGSIVIEQLASIIWGSQQLAVGSLVSQGIFTWFGVIVQKPAFALFVAAILVTAALDVALRHTRWGMRVRAAGGDPIGVAVSGINLRRIWLEIFFVGGAIIGLTGMLYGPLSPPTAFSGFDLTIKGFIAAAIGGLGYVRGALFGGLLLGILESFGGKFLGAQWQDPVSLAALILVLLLTPTGIMRIRRVRAV